jgi:molybdenum cofactor cytidylyltransferase
MRFATLILAAGASSRMGQPKLLLPWHDKTILAHLIHQWTALGASQIAAVIEPHSPLVAELDRFPSVDRIVNPHPHRGMFSSVQSAACWTAWQEPTHVVIALGDQAHVRLATLEALIHFAAANPDCICQLSRNGRPRHPVVIPNRIFWALGHATEQNLKEFLQVRESQRKILESGDPALDLDIDTPEDYEKALSIHRADSGVLSS